MFLDMVLHHENHHTCCMNGYLVQMGSQRHDYDDYFHLGTSGSIKFPNGEHDGGFDRVDNHKSDDNQIEV